MCERQQSSLSRPDSHASEDVELSSQEDEEEEGKGLLLSEYRPFISE